MRRHRVTLKGRIAHCDYGSRLCAYADRIRFRTDRNRPGVTDIDIVSAVVAQIPARKKAESGILVALGATQSVSPERGIEVHAHALFETDVPDCCIHFSTCKTIERRGTNGDISGASCVTQKRLRTNRRVAAGGGAVIKRLKAEGGVVHSGCKAKECVLTLSGVSIGIAAIRWRDNCLRCLRKRKTGQQKRNEKEDAPQRRAPDRSSYPRDYCQFKMRCCFHVFISYFSVSYG